MALVAVLVGLGGIALMVGEGLQAGGTQLAAAGPALPVSAPDAAVPGSYGALRVGAVGAVSAGMSDSAGIPFAPGYASWHRREVSDKLAAQPGRTGGGVISVSALRWQVAEAAACSWADYWLASRAARDNVAMRVAGDQLESAPFSSAIADIGSEPSGLVPVAAAVAHGDAMLLRALIDTQSFGSCSVVGPFQPKPGMTTRRARVKLAAARVTGIHILAHDPLAYQLGLGIPGRPGG